MDAIYTRKMSIHQYFRIVCRTKLDLVMRKFATFTCGRGTMFT